MMARLILVLSFMCAIPSVRSIAQLAESKKTGNNIYIIQKGDTWSSLSRKYECPVSELRKANPKYSGLKVGLKISIPCLSKPDTAKSDSVKTTLDEGHANADSKESVSAKKHLVAANETLPKIALKYKVTVQQLLKWNNLKSSVVTPGQELIVSGAIVVKPYERWNTPNSTSSKTDSGMIPKSSTQNLVEESGLAVQTESCTHPTLPLGTLVVCVNPETKHQMVLHIEKNAPLPTGTVIGISGTIFKKLDIEPQVPRIIIHYYVAP